MAMFQLLKGYAMLHVLLPRRQSYRDIVDHLVAHGGQVTVVGGDREGAIEGKAAIVRSMLSPRVWLRTRKLWGRQDRVLAVGWQALPVAALIRAGLLKRPERMLVMACFVHGNRARKIINRAWQLVRFPGLGFITFSQGESRNLVDNVGMPPETVHFHLWRQALDGQATQQGDAGYLFAGGFSNRDYELLIDACRPLEVPLVIVASRANALPADLPPHVTVHYDLPEEQFEALLANARLVTMPLRSQGEACGQSVLLRVLRNGKPLVTTRHEAIEAYLGRDYAGFVPHGDVAAMRAAIVHALDDGGFRVRLADGIAAAGRQLDSQESPGAEIIRFLAA